MVVRAGGQPVEEFGVFGRLEHKEVREPLPVGLHVGWTCG